MRVRDGKALRAGIFAIALALTACTGGRVQATNATGVRGTGAFAGCGIAPNTCNRGQTRPGGTMRYTIETPITGWNLNYEGSNGSDLAEVMDGIMPSVFSFGPDLKPFLNTDLMESVTQTNAHPQTLVYNINRNASWSDGQPINFEDFQYLKDVSDGTTCNCGPSTTAGYNQIDSMTSSNAGKTVTVVMKTPFADWRGMFGLLLPAHIAKEHGADGTAAGLHTSFQWFDKNVPDWSGGPLIITAAQNDTAITEKPNPTWYGRTKSSLAEVVFRVITDQSQLAPALQNHEVDAIYASPNADLVRQVGSLQGIQSYLGKGLIWEHLDFNEKNHFLIDRALRTAIFTAVDREAIIARTIGQLGINPAPLGNHIYVPGQPGYQDNVTRTGEGSGDLAKAKDILTNAGYTGVGSRLETKSGQPVALRCTYFTNNTYRHAECSVVQNTLNRLGIKVTLTPTPDYSEIGTGDFDMVVYSWVGTPFVVADAQQIYELKGGGDYGYNDDPAAERLIDQAAITTTQPKVQSLMNHADKLITADAYELPLYQSPTFLAARTDIVNLRDNATSAGPPYNIEEWGIKAH
jgi:peptide/nickel transport system substrate-binding protein